jgi:hypothetical protein
MADRRMLSKKITDHDNFISLSASAQALFMHLVMSADDDGFCNQVSLAMFKAHAGTQDLEALIDRKYLIRFDSGVIVIKHWKMMNTIKSDRYTPTANRDEAAQIMVKENKSYTLVPGRFQDGDKVVPGRIRSIGKVSIDKVNSSSYKGEVDFFELLSDEEIAQLKSIYQDHYELLDECQDDANRKHKTIRNPYEYVVGYAHNRGWAER